jgi:hypothetical protein
MTLHVRLYSCIYKIYVLISNNRVFRKIFGPKKDEVTGDWRKLHNEGLHNLHSSPNIIRMIKSRMVRWAGHEEQMGRRGMHIRYW